MACPLQPGPACGGLLGVSPRPACWGGGGSGLVIDISKWILVLKRLRRAALEPRKGARRTRRALPEEAKGGWGACPRLEGPQSQLPGGNTGERGAPGRPPSPRGASSAPSKLPLLLPPAPPHKLSRCPGGRAGCSPPGPPQARGAARCLPVRDPVRLMLRSHRCPEQAAAAAAPGAEGEDGPLLRASRHPRSILCPERSGAAAAAQGRPARGRAAGAAEGRRAARGTGGGSSSCRLRSPPSRRRDCRGRRRAPPGGAARARQGEAAWPGRARPGSPRALPQPGRLAGTAGGRAAPPQPRLPAALLEQARGLQGWREARWEKQPCSPFPSSTPSYPVGQTLPLPDAGLIDVPQDHGGVGPSPDQKPPLTSHCCPWHRVISCCVPSSLP